MEIAWDQIIFDNTLLGQVPEEGVSRLVTQQISERRDHYVRYGLAFMLEHGFMKTDRGRLCYRMNLEQIRNAILETAYLGVMDAYLRCKRPSFMGGIRAGMQRLTGRSLARALSQEVEQFAMVQKTEYGFDLLDVMGKKVLKQIGVTADLWILPEGMKMYLNLVRKENFQSPNAGAMGAIAPVGTRAPSKPEDVAVDVAYDCRVVETKSFELPNMSEPLNPMERPATIGEYYVMQNHLRGSLKPEDYRSAWRDVFLYNEDKDGFTRITLEAALRNCGRFDVSGDGDLVAPNTGDGGDGSDGSVPPDMFYRRKDPKIDPPTSTWALTERMGDIHSHYLRDGGLSDWADSVVAKILRAEPGMSRALRDGLDLCRRIDDTDTADGAQNTWALWLWMVHALPRVSTQWNDEHGLPYPPTKEEILAWHQADPTVAEMTAKAAATGVSVADLRKTLAAGTGISEKKPFWVVLCQGLSTELAPLMENGCGAIRAMPVGYANWPGLCVLANPRYKETFGEVHAVAAKFVAAFETLYSELSAHTHDSVFLDGAEKPPWLKSRDGRSTLFSNLLYVSHAPIWMKLERKTEADRSLMLPQIADITNWYTTGGTDMGPFSSGELVNQQRLIDPTTEWSAMHNLVFYTAPKPLVDLKVLDAIKPGDDDYSGTIASIREKISDEILDVKNANAASKATFKSILDAFSLFFGQSSLVLSRFGKGKGGIIFGGVYLATLLYELATRVKALKQADDASSAGETNTYRVAAFINMAVNVDTMKAFAVLLEAGWRIINSEEAKAEDKKIKWTWNTDEATGLKSHIESEVRDVTGGVSLADVKDYVDKTSSTKHYLPKEAVMYPDGMVMLKTHLTGGAALHALCSRSYPTGIKHQVWSSMMMVAIDPLDETPPKHHEYGRHLADHLPPMLTKRKGVDAKYDRRPGPSGAKVGFKRRFGATSVDGHPLDDEEDDPMADHALDIDPWTRDGSLPERPVFSSTLCDRWRRVARGDSDVLRRAVKLSFLGQPVNYATFARIIAADDVFPFGFLLLRPYMTYSMASAILTVGGARTGETLVGHADFQLADNVVQKMHIGNFTMYLKSIVYQPHHVWIADNVMACGYIGGNNCMFRLPDQGTDPPSSPDHPSLFACLVPYDCEQEGDQNQWEHELPNPLDITGSYASGNPALSSLKNSVKRMHYASANFYKRLHAWDNGDQNMSDDSLGTSNRYNTLTFAGHFAMYNPQTQRYDLVHENTGHRGNRIYAGCGRVWKGLAKLLEPVNHTSAFGGAPVRSMVTNAV